MKNKKAQLKPEEQATLTLRGLYEQFGYKKYKMSKFEEYSLYAANKDFLAGDKVIAFTDLDGRLLALKPDVTLSIIKNTNATEAESEKLYYIENVYRESRESNNFKEIPQMGLEYIGHQDNYSITEVLALACRTLRTVNSEYILEVSHMSFATELLHSMNVSDDVYFHLLKLVRNKNKDGIRKIASGAGLDKKQAESMCMLTDLYGSFSRTIKKAEKLCVNDEMEDALRQLEDIYQGLKATGDDRNVQMDLSMVNDIDYYNGIIFRGYFRKLARNVLAGGQYDRAMMMFGKNTGALGFALYLNEISMLDTNKAEYDVDAAIEYDSSNTAAQIAKAVECLQSKGLSVRAESKIADGLRYRQLYSLKEGKLIIKDDGENNGKAVE